MDPLLREAGGLSSWQVISAGQGQCRGRVVVAASLADVQQQRYEEPTVLLVQLVGGEDEIPEVSCSLMCQMYRRMLWAVSRGPAYCSPAQSWAMTGSPELSRARSVVHSHAESSAAPQVRWGQAHTHCL